jgi:hypothetical protein
VLKFGVAEVLDVHSGTSGYTFNKAGHRAVFQYEARPGFVYVRSRAISSRCNDNFDMFPAGEIEASWRTFVGKPVFVNHYNHDHRRARGVVIDAALHRDRNPDGSPDTWVEVLMEIDGLRYPKLAKALLAGHIDRTSMGCDVKISKCSVCGNEATSPLEYCHHIPGKKGKRIWVVLPDGRKEGRLVYEECRGLAFFENSVLVEPPADPTALTLGQVVAGPGLEHVLPGDTTSYLPHQGGGYAVDTGDLRVGGRASGLAATASRNVLGRPADLAYQLLSEDGVGIGAALPATAALDHIDGVHGIGAQQPVSGVLAQPHVTGMSNDLTWWDRADYLSVSPTMGSNAAALGVGQREAAVARVELPAGPWPTGLQASAAVDAGQVPLYLGGDAFEPPRRGRPADHGEYLILKKEASVASSTIWSLLHQAAAEPELLFPREAVKPQKPVSQMSDEEYGAHQEAVAKGNAEGKQWNEDHPISHKHIVDHWNRATPDEKANGENWYRDAHHLARHIANDTGHDMHTVAGLMSNYSPQTHWATNIMNAAKVARTRTPMGGPGSGIMATSLQKRAAGRMLEGEHYDKVLGGPKTKAFAHLIEHGGNSDPNDPKVVVDRHALSVAAGARATDNAYGQSRLGTKSRYNEASQAYHKAAKIISKQEGRPIEAHQVQAATWLVRQRLNEAHDSALSEKVTTSRSGSRARSAVKEWNEYAAEHHPGAMGKEPGTGYSAVPEDIKHANDMADEGKKVIKVAGGQFLHYAYGETKAPQDVDTLRDENCPICGNDSAFDGRECQVCGYVAPPKAFGDPDVEKAKQLDTLKQDIEDQNEGVDPSRKGAPIGEGIEDEQAALEGDDTASPWLACTNCGTQLRPAVPQTTDQNVADDAATTGPTEGDPCPVCGQGQLVSSGESEDQDENGDAIPDDEQAPEGEGQIDTGEEDQGDDEQPEDEDDPEDDDEEEELDPDEDAAIGKGKLPASKSSQATKYRQAPSRMDEGADVDMRPALAALAEQQKIIDQQAAHIAALRQRDAARSSQIQRLAAGMTVMARALGVDVEGQVRVAMIQKRADEQNPAQPIPEPAPEPAVNGTVDAKTPEAFADVSAPGMVPGSNNDVAADAVSTAYTPGQDIPSPGVKNLVDVTRPVDGTQGPRPLSEVKTEVDVRAGNPMNPQVAFPVGGPFANAQRTGSLQSPEGTHEGDGTRYYASQRLARLRKQAGLTNDDELVLGQAIASSGTPAEAINAEIGTLTEVIKAQASRTPAQPPRNLVPRAAAVQRTVPSMSGPVSTPLQPVTAGVGADADLEAIFLGDMT